MLTEALAEMGVRVVPSEANFVMIELADAEQAAWLVEELLKQGIIVRPLKAFGLPQCVRISTGTDDDNQRCIAVLQKAVHTAAR
jgi:histidinol-phosphate aminotransferase